MITEITLILEAGAILQGDMLNKTLDKIEEQLKKQKYEKEECPQVKIIFK